MLRIIVKVRYDLDTLDCKQGVLQGDFDVPSAKSKYFEDPL